MVVDILPADLFGGLDMGSVIKRGRRRHIEAGVTTTLQTDEAVGFSAGRHCISCWSPTEPCPIDVTYAKEQKPFISPKYKLCIRCNQ